MLTGQAIANEGEIRVFEHTLPGDSKRARAEMGVVPQLDNLDVDVTVEDNLAIFARLYRVPDVGEAVDRGLALARLTERRRDAVDELSGGMRRRLLLARGIVHQPRLLLLDEPTVGLDPQIRTELWSLIDGLRTEGKTILMSTHYIEEAERLADEVAVMAHGKMIARGTAQRADRRARRPRDRRGLRPARPPRRDPRARRERGPDRPPRRPRDRDRRLRGLDQRRDPRGRDPPRGDPRGRLRAADRARRRSDPPPQPEEAGVTEDAAPPRAAGPPPRPGRDRRRDEPRGRELPHLLEGHGVLEHPRADRLPARLRRRPRRDADRRRRRPQLRRVRRAPAWSRRR